MPGILVRNGVSRISGTRDDPGRAPRITAERRHAESREQADRRTSRLVFEQRPGHLDVAGHSDLRIGFQRFSEQGLRLLAITWGGAIN